MPWYEVVALLAAGTAAGTINTIVGSGTLITFPTLLVFGIPPLTANVTNTVGLVAGGFTGIHGYRSELVGQGRILRRLVPVSFLGAVTGAILLLGLPDSAFDAICRSSLLPRCCWFCWGRGCRRGPPCGIPTMTASADTC